MKIQFDLHPEIHGQEDGCDEKGKSCATVPGEFCEEHEGLTKGGFHWGCFWKNWKIERHLLSQENAVYSTEKKRKFLQRLEWFLFPPELIVKINMGSRTEVSLL